MIRPLAALRRAMLIGVVGWAAAIPAATYAASRAVPTAFSAGLALLVYGIGAVVCHQLPERSFVPWGRQLPVCARCPGIYGGAVAVAFAAVLPRRHRTVTRRNAYRWRDPRWTWLMLALAINAATVILEWMTGVAPSNGVRAAAGAILGVAAMSAIVTSLDRAES